MSSVTPNDQELEQTTLTEKVLTADLSRRSLLKRGMAIGLATPAVAGLLAACGGDDDDDDDTDASTPAGGSGGGTTPEAAETPSGEAEGTAEGDDAETPAAGGEATTATGGGEDVVAEGEIVIMQGVDANTLDPHMRNATPEFNVNVHVFDMALNRNSETLEILPSIFTEWETVDDLTWRFTLAEGATFHNGTPVTSASAVFTFERAAQPQIGEAAIVQSLATQIGFESVTAVDDYTIEVKTTKPAAIFPDLLTSFEIMPEDYYADDSTEALANVAQNPVGSGPYIFKEWVRDDHITLEANPDYWGPKPSIKTVIFRPVPELSARVVALQNEEANIVVNIAPDVAPQLESGDTTRLATVTGGRNIFIGIRCDREPFNDVRVRQALNLGIDFEGIKTALLGGYGERTRTIVNPPNENMEIEAWPYDPERAKALLAEAGVPEGFELTMDAPSGRYIKDAEMAQAIAQGYEAIGIKVNLKVLEWSVYAGELLPSGDPDDLFFLGLGSPFSGEQELFYVHPDFSLNFTFWQNDDYVAKFAELNKELDPAKRKTLMDEIQVIVQEECPWVFLWHQVDFYGASKDLQWDARADERISAAGAQWGV